MGYSVLRKQNTAIPQLWRSPAEDLFRHSAAFHPLLYVGGRNEHFAEKQTDNTQPLTFTHQRHIAPGRTRRRVQGWRKPLQKNES